ncbi:hypothetical protein OOK27_50980 [Streptomyces canus]|uniref:hypothetical protein n=1 Tax=Streptomyces canus TaxID=58343 RepID=UPI002254886A|nr:hypothetical protein [Streptomyces canus]MCX5262347.1 hypothetical protein [Streptomyces canus]
MLVGLNSSAIYLGFALGGALGGIFQNWIAPVWLGIRAVVPPFWLFSSTLVSAQGRRRVAVEEPSLATN